jgi:hypothetical protein
MKGWGLKKAQLRSATADEHQDAVVVSPNF